MDQSQPAPTQAPIQPQPVVASAPSVGGEPRNFLAVMALTVFTGVLGINRLYTGHKTQGWVRFGLYVGGLLTSWLIIGILPMLVALIWGFVDIFIIYFGNHVDAQGQPYVATDRDKKAAKLLFWIPLIAGAIYLVLVIALFSLGVFTGLQHRSTMNSGSSSLFNN